MSGHVVGPTVSEEGELLVESRKFFPLEVSLAPLLEFHQVLWHQKTSIPRLSCLQLYIFIWKWCWWISSVDFARVLYSLPVLRYAIPALSLKSRQVDELNVCWNNVFRGIFNYNKWESVKAVILSLGRINLKHLIMLRKLSFTDICIYLITACCETCFGHFCYAMEMKWWRRFMWKRVQLLKWFMINMNLMLPYCDAFKCLYRYCTSYIGFIIIVCVCFFIFVFVFCMLLYVVVFIVLFLFFIF